MAASLVLPLCRFTQTYPTSETAVEVEHLLSQRATPVASTDTAYPLALGHAESEGLYL